MRPKIKRAAAAIAALVLLAMPLHARAALLTNGNFEDGPAIPPSNPIMAFAPGDVALNGWTVSDAIVCVVTDNYWVPLSGHRSICLSDMRPLSGATKQGSVQQAFASAAGATYRLTFWLSGEAFSTPTIKHLHVSAGAAAQDYTFDVTPVWSWDMMWAVNTLDFTASGPSTLVKFTGLDATAWGPALDSMKVELLSAGVQGGSALAFAPIAPDPVRESGRLAFTLAEAAPVRLAVYDLQGRERARLADGTLGAGPHSLDFAPRSWGASPGLYLAVLRAGSHTLTRRFTVLE